MFVVIFKATIKKTDSEYHTMAAELREAAQKEYGCRKFVSISEGREEVTLSYWDREDQILRWKKHLLHATAQEKGRELYYEKYTVEVAEISRSYAFPYHV